MLLACSLLHVYFLYFRMKHIFYKSCRLQKRLTKSITTDLVVHDCIYEHNFQVKFCSLSISGVSYQYWFSFQLIEVNLNVMWLLSIL